MQVYTSQAVGFIVKGDIRYLGTFDLKIQSEKRD